jgi:hypothetical protein
MDLHKISKKYSRKTVKVEAKDVTVDGKRLDILMFEENPDYSTWEWEECGKEYRVAYHEVWYSRGGPDDYVDEVGVEFMGFVEGVPFSVKQVCDTILCGEPPDMDFTLEMENVDDVFENDEELEEFKDMWKEYILETYDFTKHYE